MRPPTTVQIAYPGVNLKLWLLGDLLGAVAYGIVLSLVVAYLSYPLPISNVRSSKQDRTTSKPVIVNACLPSSQSRNNSIQIPDRLRAYLVLHIIFMSLLSTLCFVVREVSTYLLLFPNPTQSVNVNIVLLIRYGDACTLVLANWGADLLMLWRCLVVCKGIPSVQEKVLKISLIIICLVSLGSGIAYISSAPNYMNKPMLIFASVSASINAVFTTIIVIRLASHKRTIKNILGSSHEEEQFYGNSSFDSNLRMYARLINICIESAALIVVFNTVHVGLAATRLPNRALPIPHHLLVHIYSISAMLILHRVARGKRRDSELGTREAMLPIQFQSRPDSEDSREVQSG